MKAQNKLVWILLAGIATAPTAFAKSKKADQQPAAPAADAGAPAAAPNSPSEKLDVSDLENKYWAPKDTDFSVVQNRTFTKEHKVFVSAQYGPDITGGNYLSGNQMAFSGNYFFNERYGAQLTYQHSFLNPNAAVGDLQGAGGKPNFGIMQNQYMLGFNWVPFYSKMSFLGKKILYFDMAITPTIGMTHYQQRVVTGDQSQDAFTYGFDITQYYFFSSHWAFRFDYRNQWWNEKVVHNDTTGPGAGAPIKTNMDHEMIFLFGITYYFGFGH